MIISRRKPSRSVKKSTVASRSGHGRTISISSTAASPGTFGTYPREGAKVMPMRHFDVAERRRRLLVRHHLARPGASVEQVAGDLVGVHSSDPATVVLSSRARLDPFAVADLEAALYERRTLLRMLAMRRTMFVVPLDLAAVMDASCTKALVPVERRKLVQMLTEAGIAGDVDAWIDRVRAETMAVLADERAAPRERPDQARARAGPATADRGRQEVRGHGGGVDADAVPPVDRRRHRAHPSARHVAVEPVPVDDGRAVDRRPASDFGPRPLAPSSSAGGCGRSGRARPTTSPGGRSGPRRT